MYGLGDMQRKKTLKSHLASDPTIWRILALSLSKRLCYVVIALAAIIAVRWFQGRELYTVGPEFLVFLSVVTLFWLSSVWRTFETIKNDESKIDKNH